MDDSIDFLGPIYPLWRGYIINFQGRVNGETIRGIMALLDTDLRDANESDFPMHIPEAPVRWLDQNYYSDMQRDYGLTQDSIIARIWASRDILLDKARENLGVYG